MPLNFGAMMTWRKQVEGSQRLIVLALMLWAVYAASQLVNIPSANSLGSAAASGVVVKHARHALLRQHAQVFNVGDDGHVCLLASNTELSETCVRQIEFIMSGAQRGAIFFTLVRTPAPRTSMRISSST